MINYEIRIYNLFYLRNIKGVRWISNTFTGVWSITEFFDRGFLGNQGRRKVWKSGWGKYKGGGPTLLWIGFTDLPKSGGGGGSAPRPPPFQCVYGPINRSEDLIGSAASYFQLDFSFVICRFHTENNGILFPKLFWPKVRKNCSSDGEKLNVENFQKFWDL